MDKYQLDFAWLKRAFSRKILPILLGIALAASLEAQIYYAGVPMLLHITGLLGAWLAGTGISYYLIQVILVPHLAGFSLRAKMKWISLSIMVGLALVYAIPLTLFPTYQDVKIIAIGEKNPLAKDSEVWLAGVESDQWTPPADLARICQGDWRENNNLLVSASYLPQPSELVCRLKTDDDRFFVTFGMHPWSGKARLVYEGQTIDLDLYSASGDVHETSFQIPINGTVTLVRGLIFLIDGIWLGLLLLAGTIWLITRPAGQPLPGRSKAARWYVYAAPIAFSWFIYLLAFWPGFLSPDTVDQLTQIHSGMINDWHPAFHTLTLWLITRLWFSPAAVAIAQILVLSSLIGWGLSMIAEQGAPAWLTWSTGAFLAIAPGNSLMILTLWKDVAYSIALLALMLLIFKMIHTQGKWLARTASWLILGIIIALVSIYRHNGPPVAFGTLAGLLIGYRRQWKPLLAASALALALLVGIKGPLYQAAGVNNVSTGGNQSVAWGAFNLAYYHFQYGPPLLSAESALISQIIDSQDVRAALLEKMAEVENLAIQLSLKNPALTMAYLLGRSDIVFQILQPPHVRTEFVETELIDNPLGFKQETKSLRLNEVLTSLALHSEDPEWNWLFWRNAFWMYLLLWGTVISRLRTKSWQYSLLLIPILLNALPLAAFSAGEISRYILPTLLAGPLFSGWLLLAPISFKPTAS